MGTGDFNAGGNPAMDWHPIQGKKKLLVTSCFLNRDKLWRYGPPIPTQTLLKLSDARTLGNNNVQRTTVLHLHALLWPKQVKKVADLI